MIRLATPLMPHVNSVAQSVLDMFPNKQNPNALHRPIPAPEPSPEPNPEPDAMLREIRASIGPDDWDELFRAVQARLESCVDDALTNAPQLPLHSQHEITKKVVLECVESMKQLHAALTKERQAQRKR